MRSIILTLGIILALCFNGYSVQAPIVETNGLSDGVQCVDFVSGCCVFIADFETQSFILTDEVAVFQVAIIDSGNRDGIDLRGPPENVKCYNRLNAPDKSRKKTD